MRFPLKQFRLSTRARPVACLLLAAAAAACGRDGVKHPEGAILKIDDQYIYQNDLDHVVQFLLETNPIAGDDSARAAALESGLLPRAIAHSDFAEGVAAARKRAQVAVELLKSGAPFEDVQKQVSDTKTQTIPPPVSRRMIDPILGAAVFGKPEGYVTLKPVETTYGVVIARVMLPIPEAGPNQEEVVIGVIEALYDPSFADVTFRRDRNVKRMLSAKYVEIAPGMFRSLPAPIRVTLPG